jgi:hypothetical protein
MIFCAAQRDCSVVQPPVPKHIQHGYPTGGIVDAQLRHRTGGAVFPERLLAERHKPRFDTTHT